jgi:16S rRNA (guanine(1405)-N(7))-methyltransferase
MMAVKNPPGELDTVIKILSSKKYRDLDIPPETAREVYASALASGQSPREAEKTLRHKLHNIVAPYLGEMDYGDAEERLQAAISSHNPEELLRVCRDLLGCHASTRERLDIITDFYPRIFADTAHPRIIVDLACGLNPLALPWMNLEGDSRYFAYDLNGPRIAFLNHFFQIMGREPLGYHQDILIEPPREPATLAFLFKEAHRMEQRQKGSTRRLIESVQVEWFLLSLPTNSLSGKFDLVERQRGLVQTILQGLNWPLQEVVFANEIVFCIHKGFS